MRSPVVFFLGLMIAFRLEGRLAASECLVGAPITIADVTDQDYQPVPWGRGIIERAAATVTLTRLRSTVRTANTDERGYARRTAPPGRYTLRVTASGANLFAQDVIIGAKGVGTPRVLAIWMPDGMSCATACEVEGNTALAKPPACLLALRPTRD